MELIGIDEAGRGPVFGSLFVAGVKLDEAHPLLDSVKESKSTTPKQIKSTAQSIRDDNSIETVVIEITAEEITESKNITQLTANAMVKIARELSTSKESLFVDSCHSTPEKLEEKFDATRFTSICVEHKADETYPIVSAAGCLAKQNREDHIERLSSHYEDYSIGSGYPSDTTTRTFLKNYYSENGEFPPETRLSWSTCETLRAEVEQTTIDDAK